MNVVSYNPQNARNSSKIDHNLALYNRIVKILKSENARKLVSILAEVIDWCIKDYPDGEFKNTVVDFLNALKSNDCNSAFGKLRSMKRDLNQKSQLVDQLYAAIQKVEEIGIAKNDPQESDTKPIENQSVSLDHNSSLETLDEDIVALTKCARETFKKTYSIIDMRAAVWVEVDNYPVADAIFGLGVFSDFLGEIAGGDYNGTPEDAVAHLRSAYIRRNSSDLPQSTQLALKELFQWILNDRLSSTSSEYQQGIFSVALADALSKVNLKFDDLDRRSKENRSAAEVLADIAEAIGLTNPELAQMVKSFQWTVIPHHVTGGCDITSAKSFLDKLKCLCDPSYKIGQKIYNVLEDIYNLAVKKFKAKNKKTSDVTHHEINTNESRSTARNIKFHKADTQEQSNRRKSTSLFRSESKNNLNKPSIPLPSTQTQNIVTPVNVGNEFIDDLTQNIVNVSIQKWNVACDLIPDIYIFSSGTETSVDQICEKIVEIKNSKDHMELFEQLIDLLNKYKEEQVGKNDPTYRALKKIVLHLYDLYCKDSASPNIDQLQGATTNQRSENFEKFLKGFALACKRLSTLVTWAKSLEQITFFETIMENGKQFNVTKEYMFIYKTCKYLEELQDAYDMPKTSPDIEFDKTARKKAINNALERLINLLYVMIGDSKGRKIYHNGRKKITKLKNLSEETVRLVEQSITLLNALKRRIIL